VKTGAWSPEEAAVLRAGYTGRGGAARVAAQLGRKYKSVTIRAERLGLKTHARWTADEDRRIGNLWGEKTIPEIAQAIHRTPIGVWERAKKIGLPIGCPDGCEYLSVAAKRVGFSDEGVRSICRWAGVPIRQAMGLGKKDPQYTRTVVDSFELDEAVKAWLGTETVNEAARRLGLRNRKLTACLEAAKGVPKKPRRRKHWRLPSDVIDRVIGRAA